MSKLIEKLESCDNNSGFGYTLVNCIRALYKIGVETNTKSSKDLAEGAVREYLSIEENIKKLRDTGDLMSNIFFNWKQQDRFTKEEREIMESLQVNWDAVSRS